MGSGNPFVKHTHPALDIALNPGYQLPTADALDVTSGMENRGDDKEDND